MHDYNLAWILLCLLRNQLFIEQQRRVTTNGALVYSLIILFFATFLVYTSNPFLKVPFPCLNSLAELNPVLQDPVLAIHPPCIYAGYVASAISFSLCLSKINYDIKRLDGRRLYLLTQPQYAAANAMYWRRPVIYERLGATRLYKRDLKSASRLLRSLKKQFSLVPKAAQQNTVGCAAAKNTFFGAKFFGCEAIAPPPGTLYYCCAPKITQYYCCAPNSKAAQAGPKAAQQVRSLLRSRQYNKVKHSAAQPIVLLTTVPFSRAAHVPEHSHQYETWPQVRIWIKACWSFLTVGILLGSWWAYHELGWGGWWFWDPVENAALAPWLLATACIHMAPTVTTGAIASHLGAFVLSILGTFFVRSGLLASVHSFATDSTRGLYLLLFLLSITVISVFRFLQFQSNRKQVILKTQIEQILCLQNLFFCVICTVVLCGTSAPIVFQWFCNRDVSTGAPFYNGTLIPLFTSVFFVLVYTHYTQLRYVLTHQTKSASHLQYTVKLLHGAVSLEPKNCAAFVQRSAEKSATAPLLTQPAAQPALLTQPQSNTRVASQPLKEKQKFLWNVTCDELKKTASKVRFAAFYLIKTSWFASYCRLRKQAAQAGCEGAQHCILFFFVHIICLNLVGLSFLESTYGTICFLLISSFILSKKNIFLLGAPTGKFQPSRLIGLLTLAQKNAFGAMKIAHTGIVLFITGILLSNTFKVQFTQLMHSGSVIRLGPQICCLRSIDHAYAPTFHSICGNLIVYQPLRAYSGLQDYTLGAISLCMFPEKRFFFSNQELTTTKVAIHTNLFTDFYGLIGTGSLETGWYTTIMKLPFIFCIWLGFLLATIGGAIALKRELQRSKLKWV